MAFTLNLISVDGFFIGRCSPISTLLDATMITTPGESTSSLVEISFRKDYADAVGEWTNYYQPAITHLTSPTMYIFLNYLETNGYTSINNECIVCAFDIVNDGTKTGVQICVCAYTGVGTNTLSYRVNKRTRTQSGWNYENISNARNENVDSGQTDFGLVAGSFVIDGKIYYAFGFAFYKNIGGNNVRALAVLYGDSTNAFNVLMSGYPDGKETSPEFGLASEPGGGYNDLPGTPHGTFDDSSDIIGIDAKPSVGVTTMGFVNVYKITQGQLQQLGEKLFPHFLPAEILADPAQLSTPEVLTMMIKTLYGALISPAGTTVQLADNLGIIDILMNGKLIDYVIDCHAIPTSISDATVEGLKVGYRQFNDLQVARATEDYVDVDCGSLNIGEYFANFLDFSNVSCNLWLPFVGFVPIDSEYWNGGTLHIVYRFNIVDGSFQAKVLATSSKSQLTESIIGQYGGVACVHYPITGLQYSNVVAGLVNGSINAISSGSVGDIGGVATSLANMAILRPDNPMSNGYNASSSFLSHRTPYLVIKRPTPQFSMQYPKEIGLPLNVTLPLSSVSGFTVIDNPILNIDCSEEEYNEIISLLKSGVIF